MLRALTFLFAAATAFVPPEFIGYPNLRVVQTSSESKIELVEDVSFEEKRGILRSVYVGCARTGLYLPEFEDSDGIYFRGSGRPILFYPKSLGPDSNPGGEGGIYVPSNPSLPIRLYAYVDDRAVKESGAVPGSLVGALIRKDLGKINLGGPLMDAGINRTVRASIHEAPPSAENSQ